MSLTARTNIASLMATGTLNQTTRSLHSTLSRVSSGMRITTAADDAAGLGVATNRESISLSTLQAMRNANDGISIIQTAEGASIEVVDILQRMRELAVQSSSEVLADSERSYIQDEYVSLRSEISRIASVTEFNGLQLTDGSDADIDVQVGVDNGAANLIEISLGDLRTSTLSLSAGSVSLLDVSSAQSAIDAFDAALDTVNQYRSSFGAVQNSIDSALDNAQTYWENLVTATGNIDEADYASETADMTRLQIMQQSGVAALAQARNLNQATVSLLS